LLQHQSLLQHYCYLLVLLADQNPFLLHQAIIYL
jgi:hypothetical protein